MSPATTARIVAKATAEIRASSTDPPSAPAPPPTSSASSGEARLPVLVATALSGPRVEQGRGTEAEHQRHQVEGADQADRPEHRLSGCLGRRHGVEADQDVRQASRAQHQREAEGDEVDLARGGKAVLQTRVEEVGLAGLLDGGAEHLGDVEVEVQQHQEGDQDRARHQQHGLHDLHPGGALHAADSHVEDHQQPDADDHPVLRAFVGHAEQQGDEGTRTDHLGQQVEDRDHDGRRRGGGPHRRLLHPVRQLVGHREATGVAKQLGDEEQRDQPGHEESDRVEEAVVPESAMAPEMPRKDAADM